MNKNLIVGRLYQTPREERRFTETPYNQNNL
jgi:hypothetical protein